MHGIVRIVSSLLVLISLFILTSGCSKDIPQTVSPTDEVVIQTYLDQRVITPVFGGKVFSAFKIIGTDPGKIYVIALLEEYYKKDGQVERGTGMYCPIVLNVQNGSNEIVIVRHRLPRDGADYSKDVKSMFPKELQQQIMDYSSGSKELGNVPKQRAQQWANG
jgi:hypothetical protein